MIELRTDGILKRIKRDYKKQIKYNKNIKKYINITDTRRIRNLNGSLEQLRVYINGGLYTLDSEYVYSTRIDKQFIEEEYRTHELLLLNGIQNKEIMDFINKTTQDNSDEVRTETLTLGNMLELMSKEDLWIDNNLNKLEKVYNYSRYVFYFVYIEQAIANGIIKVMVNNGIELTETNYKKVDNQYRLIIDLIGVNSGLIKTYIPDVSNAKITLEIMNRMYRESKELGIN